MKVLHCCVMLLSLQYVYTDVITENISKIFLKRNFDLNESRIILLSAQESFSILKEIQNVDDLKNHSGYLTKIGFLMLKIFNDLKQEDLEVLELFSHINEELKGGVRSFDLGSYGINFSTFKSALQVILTEIERKLVEHYNNTHRDRLNVEMILSNKNVDIFSKEESNLELTNIGYFFLEIFATLLGLSWGIISMFL